MGTDIDNIIVVNEQETITTSIDAYFKNIAILAEFANTDLLNSHEFATSGYEEYTSLAGVAEVFPTTHAVYKIAQVIFAQKTNTGVNKSAVQKVAVLQQKTTDTDAESALTRIGYADAYQFILASTDKADIKSASEYFLDKRKILHCQTSDTDVLSNAAGNVALALKTGKYKRTALWHHSADTKNIGGAVAAIIACATPGKIAAKFNIPTGITVDTFTETQKSNLDTNNVNYYTYFIGQAGKYMTRELTVNGVLSTGTKVQKQVILDRIILNLQSAGMDALVQQIGFDDRGGAVLEEKLCAVMRQLQKEQLIAEDSTDDDGNKLIGQSLKVLSIAQIKKDYNSLYATQNFVVSASAVIDVNADAVQINLAY